MNKRNKFIYWISTGLLTAMMLLSVYMYFTNHIGVGMAFTKFGYPSYLVYPLALAKLLGLIAIWVRISPSLTEWAYAGFFYDFVLAQAAHLHAGDGQYGALLALVWLMSSYFSSKSMG